MLTVGKPLGTPMLSGAGDTNAQWCWGHQCSVLLGTPMLSGAGDTNAQWCWGHQCSVVLGTPMLSGAGDTNAQCYGDILLSAFNYVASPFQYPDTVETR